MKLSLKWYIGLSYSHNISQFYYKKRIKVRPGPNDQKMRTLSSNIRKSNHTDPNGTVIFGFSMQLSFKRDPTRLVLDDFSIFKSGVPGGLGHVRSGASGGGQMTSDRAKILYVKFFQHLCMRKKRGKRNSKLCQKWDTLGGGKAFFLGFFKFLFYLLAL